MQVGSNSMQKKKKSVSFTFDLPIITTDTTKANKKQLATTVTSISSTWFRSELLWDARSCKFPCDSWSTLLGKKTKQKRSIPKNW